MVDFFAISLPTMHMHANPFSLLKLVENQLVDGLICIKKDVNHLLIDKSKEAHVQ